MSKNNPTAILTRAQQLRKLVDTQSSNPKPTLIIEAVRLLDEAIEHGAFGSNNMRWFWSASWRNEFSKDPIEQSRHQFSRAVNDLRRLREDYNKLLAPDLERPHSADQLRMQQCLAIAKILEIEANSLADLLELKWLKLGTFGGQSSPSDDLRIRNEEATLKSQFCYAARIKFDASLTNDSIIYQTVCDWLVGACRLSAKDANALPLAEVCQRLQNAPGSYAAGQERMESKPAGPLARHEPSEDSHLAPSKLAELFIVPTDPLRQRLDDWRKKNDEGWIENPDRGPREPKYLYRVGSVRPVIEALKTKEARRSRGQTDVHTGP